MSKVKKILVISANILLFQRLKKQFSTDEYQVFMIPNTENDLKTRIDELNPDIVVVDPEISILNGVEISLLIRQWIPEPILILTTAMTLDNQVRSLDMAAQNYLSKPLDMSVIAGRIEQVLSMEESAESVNG
jgi:DNA-binding response OmpR family regulator